MSRDSRRPPLDHHVEDAYDRRQTLYQEASSIIVDVTDTAEKEIIRRIIKSI